MWRQIELDGTWRGEIWDRRKNGEIYPKWLDISTVHDESGKLTNYIAIFSDITERKATEAQLEFMAYHDALTKLPNRSLLRDRFDQAIATAMRDNTLVALLFLDLDQFKAVNDSLGHEVGDQLLLGAADRINRCVRETDTVCRLGGDEFVILLTNLQNAGGASQVAQKVLDGCSSPIAIGKHLLNTSFSIGISMYPDDGNDFDTVMKLADTAMYYAKDAGRNTYRFYTEQMNVNAMERMTWLNNMHRAIERNEFVLHYQPQFDLSTGHLIGLEALIRWNSPKQGLVPPAKFIQVAEDSGLIVPIGTWVLQEACRQNRAWQDAGYPPVVVSVNLSALQFRRGNIVDSVEHILKETGLDPQWLELELTESILVHDIEQVLEIVRNLKKIGIGLAIDDFGTGYSSLTYLKRFSVDKLKIDQSFIRNLTVDFEDAAIVRSIIQLGKGLGLKTIAEGVETTAQTEYLRQEGCDEVQGYLFGHPLPADEAMPATQKIVAIIQAPAQESAALLKT
jgi:diguanylate cyclase (GGDEF)-like protein